MIANRVLGKMERLAHLGIASPFANKPQRFAFPACYSKISISDDRGGDLVPWRRALNFSTIIRVSQELSAMMASIAVMNCHDSFRSAAC
jgi:hypothetical protein